MEHRGRSSIFRKALVVAAATATLATSLTASASIRLASVSTPAVASADSPFYGWNVVASAQSTGTALDLIFPRVGISQTGNVAFLGDSHGVEGVYSGSGSAPPKAIPFLSHAAGAVAASPGVAESPSGAIVTSFKLTAGTATTYDIQRLAGTSGLASVALANAGPFPPFDELDQTPAINAAGQIAFTGKAYLASSQNLFTPKNPNVPGTASGSFNTASPSPISGAAAPSIDSAGAVLLTTDPGPAQQLRIYSYDLTHFTTLAATSSSGGSSCAVPGGYWTSIGQRPAISADGSIAAFAATGVITQTLAAVQGVFLCVDEPGGWTTIPVTLDPVGVDKSGNNISLLPDLNSALAVTHAPGAAAPLARSTVLVTYAATPNCTCQPDPSRSSFTRATAGVWTSQLELDSPSASSDAGIVGDVKRTWPVIQVGDVIAGVTVDHLDTSLFPDPGLWFSTASAQTTDPTVNAATAQYFAMAVVGHVGGGPSGRFLLRGEHLDNTPDFKTVNIFPHISVPACALSLLRAGLGTPARDFSACAGLTASGNPAAPLDFNSSPWRAFVGTRQYRGFIDIPPQYVDCSSGEPQLAAVRPFEQSPGFTPLPPIGIETTDPYQGSNLFATALPAETVSKDGSTIQLVYAVAVRLGQAARVANRVLLGGDAPFIWTVVSEEMSCSGTSLEVVRANVPSLTVYEGDVAKQVVPIGDIGAFTKSGGIVFHPFGYGLFDPECERVVIASPGGPAVPPAVPCANSIPGFTFPTS